VTVDLQKLARIQDQVADLQAGSELSFARYRERLDAAERKRRQAVAETEVSGYRHWTVAQLLMLSTADAEKARINVALLHEAALELRLAGERKAEHDRRCAEQRGVVQLLSRLQEHAGTSNEAKGKFWGARKA